MDFVIVPNVFVFDPVKLITEGTKDNSSFKFDTLSGIECKEISIVPVLRVSRIGGRVCLLSVILTLWSAVKMAWASWLASP